MTAGLEAQIPPWPAAIDRNPLKEREMKKKLNFLDGKPWESLKEPMEAAASWMPLLSFAVCWCRKHQVWGGEIKKPHNFLSPHFWVVLHTGTSACCLFSFSSQHPYPTEDEKRQIAAQTNLTLLQVNNW